MNVIEAPFAQLRPAHDAAGHHRPCTTPACTSGEAALERLRDPAARVSSHYLVEEDGRVFRLVPEERRAWHAGVSFWKGVRDLNTASVGIEIVNPGHEFGYRPFPDAQIASVIDLVTDIRTRWTVDDDRIVGHSDVAPDRKEDPGDFSRGSGWRRPATACGSSARRARRAAGRGRGGRRRSFALQAVSRGWATTARPPERSTATPRPWSPPSRGIGVRRGSMASPTGETRARLIGPPEARRLMHPAAAFKVEDEATLLAHLAAHPFVTLAAAPDGRPRIAHTPVVVRRLASGLALDFHLSRGNALATFLASGFRGVVVSLEADAYISPDWYESADQVPAWNYVTVEAEGPIVAMDEAGLVTLLDDLSVQEEARLAPKPPWTRHKMSPGRFETMTRAINRRPVDRRAAWRGRPSSARTRTRPTAPASSPRSATIPSRG